MQIDLIIQEKICNDENAESCQKRHVIKPGTPEHPGTTEHSGTLEHSGTTLEYRNSLKTLFYRTKFDDVLLFSYDRPCKI